MMIKTAKTIIAIRMTNISQLLTFKPDVSTSTQTTVNIKKFFQTVDICVLRFGQEQVKDGILI